MKVARIRKPGSPPGIPALLMLKCPCGARPVAEGQVVECACGRAYYRDGTLVAPCSTCGGPVNPGRGLITLIPWRCANCTREKPGLVRVTNDHGGGGIKTWPLARNVAAAYLRECRRTLRREVFRTLRTEEET